MIRTYSGVAQDWYPWPATQGNGHAQPQSVVLCHGCFDLLHLGHIRHLKSAKAMGDRLVVSVTDDPHVRKGVGRPHFTIAQRAEALRALSCVDEVVISNSPTAVDVINKIKPALYVKGIDYAEQRDTQLETEIAAVEALGGKFATTFDEKWSSTSLLNAERLPFATDFLARAKAQGYRDKIHAAFDKADNLRIAFVGETIIDEYRYVGPLAKPSKEFILATVETKPRDEFEGGVMAAKQHGEWKHARVVTRGPAMRKTRFVDADFSRKLFEVYSARKLELDEVERANFRQQITKAANDCDVVVVLDFGHGLIKHAERRLLDQAKFLAVNAQSNAGNFGFNLVTAYRNPAYVCLDEAELRLAVGLQDAPFDQVAEQLQCVLPDSWIVVTRGCYGAAVVGAQKQTVPPITQSALDTMGAGDAFLAVTAPLVATGLELSAAALVGNIAGAIKVSILGHQRHVGRAEILQSVDALLA